RSSDLESDPMSTFAPEEVPCPRCGDRVTRTVATSINGARMADLKRALIEDTFQLFECAVCKSPYHVDSPFIYVDLEARQLVAQYPRAWAHSWKTLEAEPLHTWRSTLVDHAPRIVRAESDGYKVRAVFGLAALRDKLLCFESGLDDGVLEALKLDLMRGVPGM